MDDTIRATFRLQLHKDFDFAAARAQVPYLSRLGISHLYLSPIHTPRAGSTHGYDVVDYGAVNAELGGEQGLRELVASLREHKMGVIVDLVPNHMAIGGHDNKAWLDLLEWGMQSHYAKFFDVDWDVQDPALRRRVHAPFLGKPYGDALAEGDLQLSFDADEGRFFIAYFEHHFPINPRHYPDIFAHGGAELASHAEHFRQATASKGRRENLVEEARHALCATLKSAANNSLQTRIDECLNYYNAADHRARAALHRLLEQQHYRLAWWRTASDEINWRRFFDIVDLAGVQIQELPAFSIVHATTFYLYGEGLIDGVRIDHIDGLADPRTYCRRLRRVFNKLNHRRPPEAPQGRAIIYVEKILGHNERLSPEWQVDGDTGYSFMNEVGALLHHPAGEEPLGRAWTALTGQPRNFEVEEKTARRRTVDTILATDFNACALALHQIARSDLHTRDWSLHAIRRVLREILVEFPVYRTYMDARGRSAEDAALMKTTLEAARHWCQPSDRELLEYIDRWLGGEAPSSFSSTRARQARLRAIARFQQLSSPVAAKSVEDTAFYRYGHLLSRNEVGSSPAQFSLSAEGFHQACKDRALRYPQCMLATATHDHKRGEDLRARLAVISEIPEQWLMHAANWRQRNAQLKREAEGIDMPDAADEYMLYQMLLGAWPLDMDYHDPNCLAEFTERIAQWQLKALREAKRNSNWIEPNLRYETAARRFLDAILNPRQSAEFLQELDSFANRIAPAGAINSLAQTLIKLTVPGVPDIYQGCELWDFSFVDPDNRRSVDYALRDESLTAMERDGNHDALKSNWALMSKWRSGQPKQYLIANVLGLRAAHPELFSAGSYMPLTATGTLSEHIFCFARAFKGQVMIVATARFTAELSDSEQATISREHWQDTHIQLPRQFQHYNWTDVLTGSQLNGASLSASRLFADLGIAALINELDKNP